MKRLFAVILIAELLFSDRAAAQYEGPWSELSSADSFYIIHENLSLRRPSERFLILEYWSPEEGETALWDVRGLTFGEAKFAAKAVSLRQLLHAGKHTDTVMEIVSIMENFDWAAMDGVDRYGNPDKTVSNDPRDDFIICMDGSSLTVAYQSDGQLKEVSRHNCAGRTALDELVEDLTPYLKVIDKQFGRDFIKPLTNIPERRRRGALTDSPPP